MNDKDPIYRLQTRPMSQEELLRKFVTEDMLPGQSRMLNEDDLSQYERLALSKQQRFELNAYRAKAKLENDAYLNLARSMQHDNRAWPRDDGPNMAEMQRAQNVNLHARELPGKDPKNIWEKIYTEARASNAARAPLIRTVCKIAARVLIVILVVGVAVAVMV